MAKEELNNITQEQEVGQTEQNRHTKQWEILISFENLRRKIQAAKGWGNENESNLNEEVELPDGSSAVVVVIGDHKNYISDKPTPSGFISRKNNTPREYGIESERYELGWIRDQRCVYKPYIDKITQGIDEKLYHKRLSAKNDKEFNNVLSLVQKIDNTITQSLPKTSKVDLSLPVREITQSPKSPKSIFSSLKGIKNAISLLK